MQCPVWRLSAWLLQDWEYAEKLGAEIAIYFLTKRGDGMHKCFAVESWEDLDTGPSQGPERERQANITHLEAEALSLERSAVQGGQEACERTLTLVQEEIRAQSLKTAKQWRVSQVRIYRWGNTNSKLLCWLAPKAMEGRVIPEVIERAGQFHTTPVGIATAFVQYYAALYVVALRSRAVLAVAYVAEKRNPQNKMFREKYGNNLLQRQCVESPITTGRCRLKRGDNRNASRHTFRPLHSHHSRRQIEVVTVEVKQEPQ
ncbi:hypothetical protein NDU88_005423 [Pleurodeles waltl]|uniref:Uncharacterized protein n=1 Tax=Pleurodeles waltl TaxID=8319 RepID=A0AAV7UL02_PLEWA|nr:hypothetical protein NDU88_005423 [Pleurodeles waltl]